MDKKAVLDETTMKTIAWIFFILTLVAIGGVIAYNLLK